MKKIIKIALPILLVAIVVVAVLLVGRSPAIIVKSTTVAEENSFCDVLPDENTANANWRIHQWHDSMTGTFVVTSEEKKEKSSRNNVCSEQMNAITAYDETVSKIETVFGGRNGNATLVFEDMDSTAMSSGKSVKVRVQSVRFTGGVDAVDLPVTESIFFTQVKNGKMKINLKDLTSYTGYRITVTLAGTDEKVEQNDKQTIVRYEAEKGKILSKIGTAVKTSTFSNAEGIYSNANQEAFLEIPFSVSENGTYKLSFSAMCMEDADIAYILDGVEYTTTIPKTQDDKTRTVTFTEDLERGKHSLKFKAIKNKIYVDFLDVGFVCGQTEEVPENTYYAEVNQEITTGVATMFSLPVDGDGYYNVTFSFYVETSQAVPLMINGEVPNSIYLKNTGSDTVTLKLKKGINKIDLTHLDGNVINSAYAVVASKGDIKNAEAPVLGG